MKWVGPFTIEYILRNSLNPTFPMPPIEGGVYVVSLDKWHGQPTHACSPLYVGSNTSDSKLFRSRIGGLLADMFGFFGGDKGHHSGGQSINTLCRDTGVSPLALYLGWAEEVGCNRCAENRLYDALSPKLNKKRPAECNRHSAA